MVALAVVGCEPPAPNENGAAGAAVADDAGAAPPNENAPVAGAAGAPNAGAAPGAGAPNAGAAPAAGVAGVAPKAGAGAGAPNGLGLAPPPNISTSCFLSAGCVRGARGSRFWAGKQTLKRNENVRKTNPYILDERAKQAH